MRIPTYIGNEQSCYNSTSLRHKRRFIAIAKHPKLNHDPP